ncbi:MAG TPA: ClpXP protease specificity-enhancing factor SspB [Rhodoblastus sp.]|nr:ClpXP protease specificity-enhancing factor SspB [Rhodoblastus sp.]
MATDHIRYDLLVQEAFRSIFRKVLTDAAQHGLPGEHHFYITFKTGAPGVVMSDRLRAEYPEQMTIILQHQFWDLKVHDQNFEVGLSFRRVPEKLEIPFAAVTGFFDPSVNFGAEFTAEEVAAANSEVGADAAPALAVVPAEAPVAETPAEKTPAPPPAPAVRPTRGSASEPAVEPPAEPVDDSPKVVSIDAFRKKNT